MNEVQKSTYDLIKSIIYLAYKDEYDMESFILLFFLSEQCNNIVLFNDIIYYHPEKVYIDFLKDKTIKKSKETYDITVLNYICYIYLAFSYRTKESFKSIFSILPISTIVSFYELYHTLSEERVIFISKINYNLKMNPIRKSRMSHIHFDYSNKIKNLFIAKNLYLKLFNYPEIKDLHYIYKEKISFLESNNVKMFISTIDEYNFVLKNNVISNLKFDCPNNILVILLNDNENIDKKELTNIFHAQEGIPFDKILVYKNEKILFINSADGYHEFYIPITNLDLKKIEFEYSTRFQSK